MDCVGGGGESGCRHKYSPVVCTKEHGAHERAARGLDRHVRSRDVGYVER